MAICNHCGVVASDSLGLGLRTSSDQCSSGLAARLSVDTSNTTLSLAGSAATHDGPHAASRGRDDPSQPAANLQPTCSRARFTITARETTVKLRLVVNAIVECFGRVVIRVGDAKFSGRDGCQQD